MDVRKKTIIVMVLLMSVLLVGLVALNGCKKKSEPAATEGTTSIVTEQTVCPVMGGAINKNMFTEYKGKKVYFCCAGCKEKFEKEPEKYLAKLPQFKD